MKNAFSLLAVVALAACASGGQIRAFSTDWLDDQGKSIAALQERLRGAKPSTNADVAVAVAGNGDKIVGASLGGGTPWTFRHGLDARPIVTGNVVVASGAGEAFVLDAATGKKLWGRPSSGMTLLGAGDDGTITACTFARPSGSTLLIVGRDGAVKRQIESDSVLGDPAVLTGFVFVPWANQYVSVIDPESGNEAGRVTLRDKVTRAVTIGDGLYFGDASYIRFDEQISLASRGGANRVTIPPRELPGTPRLLSSGTEKRPPTATAQERDRLFARPTTSAGTLGLDSDRFYASYFRIVFGFEGKKGQLSWVHTHASDVLGGDAVAGGIAICDQEGKIDVLDATSGALTLERSFGEPIRSCTIHADTFKTPAPIRPPTALADQIKLAVESREATLVTAQRLLLRELTTIADESATETLITISSDARAAPALIADARAALATRRSGARAMLTALSGHYDFIHDVLAGPPVGPLADALAAMNERTAAPLLASHLLDPADSDDDVMRAAVALVTLATPDQLASLRQFFAIYHATASTEEMGAAVGSVAQAILRLDPEAGRAEVLAASADANTSPAAKARIDAALAAVPASRGVAPAVSIEPRKHTPGTPPRPKK